MRHTLLMSLVVIAGCVSQGDEPDLEAPGDPATSVVTSYIAGESEQGRHILGSFADTLLTGGVHFSVSVTPVGLPAIRLSVNPAGLGGANGTHLLADDGVAPGPDHAGADPWFVGLTLSGTDGQLRIRGVGTIGTTVTSTIYFLDYRPGVPGNFGPWVDYCNDGSGAIPLAGYYDSRRIHKTGPSITFACADGVAQKCNDWGYPAGNAGPGDVRWDFHQACTPMANADYCRSGKPYTREKTPILVRDYAPEFVMPYPSDIGHPSPYPGDPDTHYFEAGWRTGDLPPVCLSKLRWASLPPNPCPSVLPDPRYVKNEGVQFCDDMTIAQIQGLGALVINGSKMMDAPLGRWRNPASGDVVATIRGFVIDRDGVTGPDSTSTIPFPGYTEYLGVDSMILRNLPGTLTPADMYRLYSQVNPMTHDRVTARDPVPGHVLGLFEGYSFQSSTTLPGLRQLKLCNVGSDYRTSIGTPFACTLVGTMGYALPPLP